MAIGHYPELSLKAARDERDRLATMAAHGKSPATEKQIARTVQAANTTVREFAERYYNEVVVRDRKDPRNLRRHLDNEILPTLGSRTLHEVTAGLASLTVRVLKP